MNEIEDLISYEGHVAIDTGLFIELFLKSEIGKIFKTSILENPNIKNILEHYYTITEIYYVLCRNSSPEIAREFVEDIKRISRIIPPELIWQEAGDYKCQFAISISDCYSLAIAKHYDVPVLFKREKELLQIKDQINKDIQLILI